MTELLSFTAFELGRLQELTEVLGFMPPIDVEDVEFGINYRLELRLIPIPDGEEE